MHKVIDFFKKETVLSVSFLLALASCFFVPPNAGYIQYINFRTLCILWCLMTIMAGLRGVGFFTYAGRKLLSSASGTRTLCLVLVLLCFFFGMFVTNDVALITFVPFAIVVLHMANLDRYLIPVIALQTAAAHLGSMLLPTGNPHNLYLFALSGWSFGKFVGAMAPYSVAALLLLVLAALFITRKKETIVYDDQSPLPDLASRKKDLVVYFLLFALVMSVVIGKVSYVAVAIIIFFVVLLLDKKILLYANYGLLLTFVCLFVFIGNMKQIPAITDFFSSILEGRVLLVSILTSQVISNVPTSILLSGFTNDYFALALGTDLGGLGSLVASMANLISLGAYGATEGSKKGKFLAYYAVLSILILLPLIALYYVLT